VARALYPSAATEVRRDGASHDRALVVRLA
jgi:hypothetical protein